MYFFSKTLFLLPPIPTLACSAGLLAALCASTAMGGEYYKWVDDKGVAHFSERPPQASNVEKIKTNARTPTKEETAATTTAETEGGVVNNTTKASTLDPNRCNTETLRLKSLTSGARIRMEGPNGEPIYLEKAQIDAEIQKSRQAISESCAH